MQHHYYKKIIMLVFIYWINFKKKHNGYLNNGYRQNKLVVYAIKLIEMTKTCLVWLGWKKSSWFNILCGQMVIK
jgi:hypothetical protein